MAFSALCHALEEKQMVAIVRYVSRANTDPKVGFLSAHIKSNYEVSIHTFPFNPFINTRPFLPQISLRDGVDYPLSIWNE